MNKEEQIEAKAREIYETDGWIVNWVNVSEQRKEVYRAAARRQLDSEEKK